MKRYFIGRMTDVDRPYRVYSSDKYFDTSEVVFRTDSYSEAKTKTIEFNKLRKVRTPELFVRKG